MINIAGSIGIGSICGWLIVVMAVNGERIWKNSSILILATVIMAVWVSLQAGWRAAVIFLISTIFFFLIHLWWKRYLRLRILNKSGEKEEYYA